MRIWVLLTTVILILFASDVDAKGRVTIFAASSTQTAIDTIAAACPELADAKCRVYYAASSSIARQISAGAPADIYISANQKWMGQLASWNLVDPETVRIVASNSLVVIAPIARDISINGSDEMLTWLKSDRIAIGDPEHVPAGIYAQEAFMSLGFWGDLRDRALRMPNVRSVLAVVGRNEAHAGVVYATDALVSDQVSVVYQFDPAMHSAILYPAGVVNGRYNDRVQRVFDLLTGDWGRDAFKAAGFLPPPPP
jgi:molybdate transport system substrate-binding protein